MDDKPRYGAGHRWTYLEPGEEISQAQSRWRKPKEGQTASDASDEHWAGHPDHIVVESAVGHDGIRYYNARSGLGHVIHRMTLREAVDDVIADASMWKAWVVEHYPDEWTPRQHLEIAEEMLRRADASDDDEEAGMLARLATSRCFMGCYAGAFEAGMHNLFDQEAA